MSIMNHDYISGLYGLKKGEQCGGITELLQLQFHEFGPEINI